MGTGAPAPSDRNVLTIGPDGPILLHDVHFLEQMAHFNREKVIERQPHAKGSGAFGVFETTEDVSSYTKAALFQKRAKTEMLAPDYPLIKVGTMTLNRNPENFFAQIEQAAFSPGNTVPGIGLSPDKMLLARAFAYADAQRNRIGANFRQIPVNRPKVAVNSYMFDGPMAYHHSGNAPVYATNSGGRSWADETGPVDNGWEADGTMVRSAYTPRANDDDFTQPGILVREVFDDGQRAKLVDQVAGSLLGGVREPVLSRAFQYWKNIDEEIGSRIEARVLAGTASKPAEGMGER